MSPEITSEAAARHDALVKEGWALIEGRILLGTAVAPRSPGFFLRRRLGKAVGLFRQALEIHPGGWQSWWALGKIHQRLGDLPESLDAFRHAHEINPEEEAVLREAGIVAAELGDGPDAVRFGREACDLHPDDAGLLSNLAVALLIDGRAQEAREVIGRARGLAPGEPTVEAVHTLVAEVLVGRRKPPETAADLRT